MTQVAVSPVILAAFGLSFVGGPALCAGLLLLPSSLQVLLAMAAAVVGTLTLGLVWETARPLASLAALWLGWVLAVSMLAHALFRRTTGRRIRRWIKVAAILSTPLPWFGLATAQMMT